jgi:hypothetical protein
MDDKKNFFLKQTLSPVLFQPALITKGVDGGRVELKNLAIKGGTGEISFEPVSPVEITSRLGIRLVPVVNRGVTYYPPEPGRHLGNV